MSKWNILTLSEFFPYFFPLKLFTKVDQNSWTILDDLKLYFSVSKLFAKKKSSSTNCLTKQPSMIWRKARGELYISSHGTNPMDFFSWERATCPKDTGSELLLSVSFPTSWLYWHLHHSRSSLIHPVLFICGLVIRAGGLGTRILGFYSQLCYWSAVWP